MPKAHRYTLPDLCYACTVEDGGLLPGNATYDPLPPKPWVREWPKKNTGTGWTMVEDHRERKEPYFPKDVEQESTPYWMPAPFGDDTHQSPARHMTEIGPLPEGHTLTQPEKPLAVAQTEKRREIDAGYESALIAALTMPSASPTPMTVAVETSALLAVDPDGVDSIRAVLDVRRAELRVKVQVATTLAEVKGITVSYPI